MAHRWAFKLFGNLTLLRILGDLGHAGRLAAEAHQHRLPLFNIGWSPRSLDASMTVRETEAAARAMGVQVHALEAGSPSDVDGALTQMDLLLNLKTAKALGLTVPQSLRVRAERVIE